MKMFHSKKKEHFLYKFIYAMRFEGIEKFAAAKKYLLCFHLDMLFSPITIGSLAFRCF